MDDMDQVASTSTGVETSMTTPALLVEQFPELMELYNQQQQHYLSAPSPSPQPSPSLLDLDYFSAPSPYSGGDFVPQQSLSSLATKTTYRLHDFVFTRTLGTGSFGRVHLVQSKHNAHHYAIKVFSKAKIVRLKQIEHTNSERSLLAELNHPFLVRMFGSWQDRMNLYMVMEFVPGGELFTLIRRSGRFPESVAKFYAAETALAITFLHSMGIIYRDLKPENILLSTKGHVKLTDFGFAKRLSLAPPSPDDPLALSNDKTYTLCGTPDYLAPEVIRNEGYGVSVDWYSWGVLIYEMLTGYPPFFLSTPTANPVALYESILNSTPSYPPPLFNDLTIQLLQRCITPDLTRRYGSGRESGSVKDDEWFREVDWVLLEKGGIGAPFVPTLSGGDAGGDSSMFETYPEGDYSEYGLEGGEDPYRDLFVEFG